MSQDEFRAARHDMVDYQLRRRGIRDEAVLEVMEHVPRHRFVPESRRPAEAYSDGPVPIGSSQTISQPYMVALMTAALELKKTDKVLEIGTGSGYQAAICAELAGTVYTIERIPELHNCARELLLELGYENINCILGDGTIGLAEHAPFDAIIVTAGAPTVPGFLEKQLAPDGRMVIPVGDRMSQVCLKVTDRSGKHHEERLTACTFVPLIGRHGWNK
ncbi:MAG: protein-L-isoaspartate(D-aspartate) O-methyltransferase [Planctomycetota bacterium]|nr:MAG: protein-L-isoaspartate(D-aspartate) O-methyltransferase [Planctomycetota bacterium]